MGTKNTGLPLIELRAIDEGGNVLKSETGRFGHNAIFTRQNAWFYNPAVDHIRIYRIKEKDTQI